MKKLIGFLIVLILFFGCKPDPTSRVFGTSGAGWQQVLKKQNFKDSTNYVKLPKVNGVNIIIATDTLSMLRNYLNIADSTTGNRAYATDHRVDLIEATLVDTTDFTNTLSSIQTRLDALTDSIAVLRSSMTSFISAYPIYYVNQSAGSDDSTGLSPAQAWKTIAKVNATTLAPGAQIRFNRGDTWREQLTIPTSGTEEQRIVFTAYGTGRKPIINASDIITGWVNNYGAYPKVWGTVSPNAVTTRCMVAIDDSLYTQVATFAELTSARKYFIKTTSTPDSLFAWSASDPDSRTAEVSKREYGILSNKTFITLSYLDFRMAGNKGVVFYGSGTAVDGYTIIDSCNFYRNRLVGAGFYDGWRHSLIRYCSSNSDGNGFVVWGTQTGGSPTQGGVGSDFNTITHNYITNTIHDWTIAGQHSDGTAIQIFNADNVIVEDNEVYHAQQGIYLDAWAMGTNNMICRYNYIHECNTVSSSNAIGVNYSAAGDVYDIYYNLVVNCGNLTGGYAAIMFPSSNDGTINFFNNTVYNNGVAVIGNQLFAVHGTNINLKNNIFSFSTASDSNYALFQISSTGFFASSDYNQLYKSTGATAVYAYAQYNGGAPYTTIAAWRSASGLDANSLTTDPLFTTTGSNFDIQAGSPCINSGVTISTIPPYDILGRPLVGQRDKGCYEKQ